MRSETAPAIRLEDYQPPLYRIDKVALNVELAPGATRVTATLEVSRQPGTEAGAPLVLDGDELSLAGIKLNGEALAETAYAATAERLELASPPADPFELTLVTELDPDANTKLMGLYRSSATYCTQCEAEGFRRITYFLDRPDVLAVYTTRLEASKKDCPVLLANGNLTETGDIDGTGRHYAVWHDPHPKPAYLFALVAGDLAEVPDTFTTMSGKEVALNIYVEHGKESLCDWAMDSLKRSMRWDEEVFGREYDLDVFNIVAVSDFNMGAMENKGLNIFNDKYVLADPETATDQDYANIEAVIAHEYFHNWTGNRITCRDWFQLCLKEGLTVFRDQEFSSDMRSRAVKRIADVRLLKSHQFPEDAGPLAHPVRPRTYHEINNFYTATVYEKGAEVVRMLQTLLGEQKFRAGLDLYFDRHDGEATTIEAFLSCFEEASSTDLEQFSLWYEQAGTPVVSVETEYDPDRKSFAVSLSQEIPPIAGQKSSKPAVIPLRFGLIGPNGEDMETGSVEGANVAGDVLVLDKAHQDVVFHNVAAAPVLSLLRGFSAPVRLNQPLHSEELLFQAAQDRDPFNRWQAVQTLAMQDLVRLAGLVRDGSEGTPSEDVIGVFASVLGETQLDEALRAQALTLPSEADVAQEIGKDVNPDAIHTARQMLRGAVAARIASSLVPFITDQSAGGTFSPDAQAAGKRALANRCLHYYAVSGAADATDLVWSRFASADNMTDRLAALTLLVHDHMPREEEALAAYRERHKDSSLAMDKWFMTQATVPGNETLDRVKALMSDPSYDAGNPNRVRSLLQSFATGNPTQFARMDGAGFELIAESVLEIDKRNPQVASRLLTSFRSWRALDPQRSALAESALLRISACENLSRDSRDIVDRTLQ
ncbi:aminopeptidase N [Roseibium aggregatum]|uniref:aminopeptidase N n=1 Tax=Roseibium aggregatum TaxID=187304 RepID=UPI001A8F612B|nr:aminopeptidase N [Roseibium aggregatum]MBN8180279.1 aminopeptidase N [Roseibium aggregatum]UES45584.1 aminopeptidase N [Roseibium aggregatum]